MTDDILDNDLISQDDIDALLSSSGMGGSASDSGSSPEEEMGELSQDDIDSLLNSNALASETVPPDEGNPADDSDDDDGMELISQDDIDQLMQSGSDDSPEDDADEDFSELISQDDINDLLKTGQDNPDETSSRPEAVAAEDGGANPAIGDDMAVPGGEAGHGEPPPVEPGRVDPEDPQSSDIDDGSPDDTAQDIIDESQAVDIQDCLITQSALDALLEEMPIQPDRAGGGSLEAPASPGAGPEAETGSAPASRSEADDDIVDLDLDADEIGEDLDLAMPGEPEAGTTDTEDDISQDDIDDLLGEADEGSDVSQEDIDALLSDAEESDVTEDEDMLISQDDIDSLLMASDQEDEDVLGALSEDEEILDGDMDDLTEDILDDRDGSTREGAGEEDRVVLEGFDGDEADENGRLTGGGGKRRWYRSRLVLACAGAGLVLAVLLPALYFLFFSPDKKGPSGQVAYTPAADTANEIIVDTVDITIDRNRVTADTAPSVSGSPGNMELKGFLVLAPDDSTDLSYVAADISIDYADKRAYDEISANLPFYRGLIYESIQQTLVSDRVNDVTEADMVKAVESALKNVLPGPYIHTVRFDSFKAG